MSKTMTQLGAEKVIKRILLRILVSLFAGKLGVIVLFGMLLLFIGAIITATTQSILSYVPSFNLPCFTCKNNSGNLSQIGKNEIPEQYLNFYYGAEQQFGVPWNILAAVHRVETIFSTMDPMVSSVGAIGHMQFMPKTWLGWSYPGGTALGDVNVPDDILTNPDKIAKYGGYGMDANGDGRADPFDVQDAIYSAAKYLKAAGGEPFDAQKALFSYNREQAYVDKVLDYAYRYADGFSVFRGGQGSSLPYDSISREWMNTIEWKDPQTGEKKVGLNSELQAQAFERDIRISNGMLFVLAEKSGRKKKEEKAREYAEILQPRNLKVTIVKKTGTVTTVRPLTDAEMEEAKRSFPSKKFSIDSMTLVDADPGSAESGVNSGQESIPRYKTEVSTVSEELLFISEVTTYKGHHTFHVAYEDSQTVTTDETSGITVTTDLKLPVLSGTTLDKSDALLDAALKKAHIRGKKGKLELLTLTRLFDPNFYDERLTDAKDLFIFSSSGGQLQWPTPGFFSISSPYGYRKDPVTGKAGTFHAGMDVPVPVGTPVAAAADGEVVTAGYHSVAGNHVKLDHGGGMETRYLHMKKLYVKPGELVKRGQVIGESGNTGKSTGPHLHLEVIINGDPVDPYPYFKNKRGESVQ